MLKALVTTIVLVCSSSLALSFDLANPPHPVDKGLHVAWGIGTEALVSSVATHAGSDYGPELGLTGAVITGIVKELTDKNIDAVDALATIGGGLIAYTVDKGIRLYVESKSSGAVVTVRFAM